MLLRKISKTFSTFCIEPIDANLNNRVRGWMTERNMELIIFLCSFILVPNKWRVNTEKFLTSPLLHRILETLKFFPSTPLSIDKY